MLEHAPVMRRCAPPVIYACGFSLWKKPIVRRFFVGSRVVFVRCASTVPPGGVLAVWGRRPISGPVRDDVHLIRLEDGFLRSVGLGADLVRPISWVLDSRGMYYDAAQSSDLEVILQATAFSTELLSRATRLRERIVSSGLTKYNVGHASWRRPAAAQRVILVPGQVETDASLRFGAPGLRTNLALLRAVRKANPDAYLVYKPHPDVLAGLRAGGEGECEAQVFCDEIVLSVSMGHLLRLVDEVHVLTSVTGFEALLRGKAVTCYGQPFYAGWGLTKDVLPLTRRTRRLSVEELIIGTLILYPTYISYSTGELSTPERALDDLLVRRESSHSSAPWWRPGLRLMLRMTTS